VPRFEDDLRSLINQHSKENESNTPDFILAKYMDACLDAFRFAVNARERWCGRGRPDAPDTTRSDQENPTYKPVDESPTKKA
jgi:hypothetical protein